MTRRAAGRVALALLMVLTVVSGPVAGNAAAETTFNPGECGLEDAQFGTYNIVDQSERCGLYDNSDDIQSEKDAYAMALAMGDAGESYTTTRSNLGEDIRGLLWMKGKSSAIEALNNGANQSEFNASFKSGVRNHTSLLVRNDLARHTAATQQLAYLSAQTGGTNASNGANVWSTSEPGTAQVTLPNGDTMEIHSPIRITSGGDDRLQKLGQEPGIEIYESQYEPGKVWLNYDTDSPTYHGWGEEMIVGPEDTSPPYTGTIGTNGTTAAMNMTRTSEQISSYITAQNQVIANGDQWTAAAYTAYESGEIEATDLWDPVTLANEASTEYNSTGYYSFANAELSAIGLTGDTNVSHTVNTNITVKNITTITGSLGGNATYTETTYDSTIQGTLFIAGSDSMSLNTGQTYDPATLTGTVYMTVASASYRTNGTEITAIDNRVEVENKFTIQEATDTNTGESVDVTNAEDKNYDTTNATRLEQQIDRLIAERRALEEDREAWNASIDTNTTNAGGGIPWPDGQQVPIFIVLTGLIAIVILNVVNQSRP